MALGTAVLHRAQEEEGQRGMENTEICKEIKAGMLCGRCNKAVEKERLQKIENVKIEAELETKKAAAKTEADLRLVAKGKVALNGLQMR